MCSNYFVWKEMIHPNGMAEGEAMTTCIVVADSSRARLLAWDEKPDRPWRVLAELEHPESREKDKDLVEGDRGRTRQGMGTGARSAMEPPTAPHEVEHEVFARLVAEKLREEFDRHACDSVVLVAPPHFLGLLRKSLGPQVEKHVRHAIDKDYARLSLHELQAALAGKLQPTG
jgi:protein required for attachment to host cells